jgi:NADH:ubiquinone oxidoreductase subunit F (NADH-binding)
MQEAGLGRECTITVVQGPDEYLYGEEKAMLEVIEGNPPLPRQLPPYEHGLFVTLPQMGWDAHGAEPGHEAEGPQQGNPTLVNNVETLANVPMILARGADWFRTSGTAESPGHLLVTVVGDVVRPGVAEVELGTPLRSVIDGVGGGVAPGRSVKAVLSGVSNAVVTADHLDVPLSYEGFAAIGSGMGAGGFAVYDDTACLVEVARQLSRFLWVESCAQCPACKRGTGEITDRLARLEAGAADATVLDELARWLRSVTDGNRCYLPVEEQVVVASILTAFAGEVDEHLTRGSCPRPRPVPFPKLVDLRDGVAVYDERHRLKQPDWTYSPAG